MEKYKYNDLEKHFTAPKIISPFYQYKKVQRKLKKKYKWMFNKKYNYLEIGQKLWWILEFENMDYKRFIIKKVIEKY